MQINQLKPKLFFNNQISKGQIDIWAIVLHHDFYKYELLDHILPVLSANEINRMREYYFYKDQIKFGIRQYYLKKILSTYLKEKPENIIVGYQKYSKPFLMRKDQSYLKFNTSHSNKIVIYAFSLDNEVGIDIEKYNTKINVIGMSEKYFSQSERSVLDTVSTNLKIDLFYNIWTCKEAYLKYHGYGLNVATKSFSIYPQDENLLSVVLYIGFDKQSINKRVSHQQDKYFLSLCTSYRKPRVQINLLTNRDLI